MWRAIITGRFRFRFRSDALCRVSRALSIDHVTPMCFRLRRDVIFRCRSAAKRRNEHQTPLSSAQSGGTAAASKRPTRPEAKIASRRRRSARLKPRCVDLEVVDPPADRNFELAHATAMLHNEKIGRQCAEMYVLNYHVKHYDRCGSHFPTDVRAENYYP